MKKKGHSAYFGLTEKERRWAFKHAKEHAVEAMQDLLTDEHHSVVKRDGKTRTDIHEEVMRHLERWFRDIRRASFAKAVAQKRAKDAPPPPGYFYRKVCACNAPVRSKCPKCGVMSALVSR